MATERFRYTVALDRDLFDELEKLRLEMHFPNRSQATEFLIRLGLEKNQEQHSQTQSPAAAEKIHTNR